MLRQYFAHEQRCEEHARRALMKSGGSPRGNRTGILPVITANTDVASLRRSRSSPRKPSVQSPSSPRVAQQQQQQGAPAYPLPFELPKQGIGYKVDDISPPTTADTTLRGVKTLPSHGKLPPYGRRMITKEFFDEVSGGGIACLHPMHNAAGEGTTSPRARVAASPRH